MKLVQSTSFVIAVAFAFPHISGCSGTVEPTDPATDDDDPILGSPGDGDGDGDGDPGDGDEDTPGAWTLVQPCTPNAPSDDILIEEASLSGSFVEVTASHSAGCADHSYGLCYDREWAESYPVQIGLRLMHDAHGEPCEALQTIDLAFDLGPLEEAYNDAYQSDGGAIALSLGEFSFTHRFGSEAAPPPTWDEIDAAIEELNSCEVVDDCVAISTRPCGSAYVNATADTGAVQDMIEARNEADYGSDPLSCTAECQCGVLRCESGKCVAAPGDCMDVGSDERNICL